MMIQNANFIFLLCQKNKKAIWPYSDTIITVIIVNFYISLYTLTRSKDPLNLIEEITSRNNLLIVNK